MLIITSLITLSLMRRFSRFASANDDANNGDDRGFSSIRTRPPEMGSSPVGGSRATRLLVVSDILLNNAKSQPVGRKR